jgi:hypothetical protein
MNKVILSITIAVLVILGSVGPAWAASPGFWEKITGPFSSLANALFPNFQITTAKPDIAVTSITVTPATPQPGQMMTIKTVVTNLGKATAVITPDMFRPEIPWLCTQLQTCYDTGCSKIPLAKCSQWTTSAEAHCTCGLNVMKTTTVLTPGAHSEVVFTLVAPQKAGLYQLYIRLDPGKKLSEINTDNNMKYIVFSVGTTTTKIVSGGTVGNTVILKSGQSANVNGYTVKCNSIASASGGTADAFITVCQGNACSDPTGFKSGDKKDIRTDSMIVTIKVNSVAYGASVSVSLLGASSAPSGGGSSSSGVVCLKAAESGDSNGYTVTVNSVATASGGTADAFVTVCKGDTCTTSIGFKSGDTKIATVGDEAVAISVSSVAYGANACVSVTRTGNNGNGVTSGTNCLKAAESVSINGYTVKANSIATASGGAADAFITVCKGDTCSASTAFKNGDTKTLIVDKAVKVTITSVAYGANVCFTLATD